MNYLPRDQQFCFSLSRHLSFSSSLVPLKYVSTCFVSVFHPFVFSPSQWLSRAIHQLIFSHLVDAQFADCITCLTNTYSVLACTDCYIFPSLLILYFWIWRCLYIFHSHVSIICYLSVPVCSHRLSKVIMDCHPKGSGLPCWYEKSNLSLHSFVSTHLCLFHFSPQNPYNPV